MEESRFDAIGKSRERLLEFFIANFEDVVELVGEEKLVEQYFTNPRLPLISVKVFPLRWLLCLGHSQISALLDANLQSAIPTITRTAA